MAGTPFPEVTYIPARINPNEDRTQESGGDFLAQETVPDSGKTTGPDRPFRRRRANAAGHPAVAGRKRRHGLLRGGQRPAVPGAGADYVLIQSISGHGPEITGKTVSKDYQVVKDIQRRRLWVISPESPGWDPDVEAQFSDVDSAAILIGRDPSYILSLGIRHHGSENDLLVLLETIRASIGLKLREQAYANQMKQAQAIQHSLLPGHLPELDGYEISAISHPASEVGGDVYDVQQVEEGVLGLMLADASGHGLPAALQARDVVIGMRMGQAEDEKITATVSRLNRVIHHSGLASRFISLFYGELEETGNLVYVNGGHCPPLLFAGEDEVFELKAWDRFLAPCPTRSTDAATSP